MNFKKSIAATLACSTLLTIAPMASSAEEMQNVNTVATQQNNELVLEQLKQEAEQQHERFQVVDKLLDQYVTLENNQYVLNLFTNEVPEGLKGQISEQEIQEYRSNLEASNNVIVANNLTVQDKYTPVEFYVPAVSPEGNISSEPGVQYAYGVNKVVAGKGYLDIYLDRNWTQRFAVGGAAAVGALVALIPGVGWIVAGAIIGAVGGLEGSRISNGSVHRYYPVKKVAFFLRWQ
jgi:hypothetical protein